MPTPKLSVIIVAYNSENFIERCITSLRDHEIGPKQSSEDWMEIIILDNASQDGTVKMLKKFLPEIKLIESSENLGFSKGNNKAVKEAKGEYLFFLNPDTELERPVLKELIDFYENTPETGIVGPKLEMGSGKTQPSVRKLPTVIGAFKEYVLGIKNSYEQYVPFGNDPVEVESVYGAAMLIKKELFEKAGGFDEKFFLYYEDADLCKKVRELGKKIYYYPGVLIKHLVGVTKSEIDKYKLNLESAKKYHGQLGAFILQLIFLVPRLRRHYGR